MPPLTSLECPLTIMAINGALKVNKHKTTKTQNHKNTKVTINSELSLYKRTGNSTHARCIADRLVMGVELGNIDAQFLLDLEARLSLVPHGVVGESKADGTRCRSFSHSVSQAIEFLNMIPLHLDDTKPGSSHVLHYVSMAKSHLGSIEL